MAKIRKNDEVMVLTGRSRQQRGRVLRVLPDQRVIVEGLNLVKKHVKRNPQRNINGGIVEKEAPIHISNVALLDASTQKPSRVGYKVLEDGRKVRYFKASNETVTS